MKKITSGRRLIGLIEAYIEECHARGEVKKPAFANIAGFCRFAGISVGEFLALRKKYPEEFEKAGAFFEDAALNSGATATLVGMYLREYGFWGRREPEEEIECEHDIYGDGI